MRGSFPFLRQVCFVIRRMVESLAISHINVKVLFFSVLVGMLPVSSSAMADTPMTIEVHRDGETLCMHATIVIDAPPEMVWEVLTDYEGQLHFVPGLSESRVIARNKDGSVVMQKGWVEVLFIRIHFEVEYATHELPPRQLTSRVIRGSVKRMKSKYRLLPDISGTRLDYVGEVEPGGWLPPVIGPLVIRRKAEAQIGAMVQEIERRGRGGSSHEHE